MKYLLFALLLPYVALSQTTLTNGYVDTLKANQRYTGLRIGQTFKQTGSEAVYYVARSTRYAKPDDGLTNYRILVDNEEENLIRYSENLSSSIWNKEGRGRPEVTKQVVADPRGNPAQILSFREGSNYRALSQIATAPINGEAIQLTFWLKRIDNTQKAKIIATLSGAGQDFFLHTDTLWHQYSVTLRPQQALGGLASILRLRFIGFSSDQQIAVTCVRLSRTENTPYLKTEQSPIIRHEAFANWQLTGNRVYWSQRPLPLQRIPDHAAFNYLQQLGEQGYLKEIFIDQELRTTETLYLREGVSVLSSYAQSKVTPKAIATQPIKIVCDLNDKNADCLKGIAPAGERTYMAGSIRSLLIENVSPCRTVLDVGGAHFGIYEDITIIANHKAQHGFRMGREAYTDSLACIGNALNRVRVYYAASWAFLLDDIGNINKLQGIHAHRSKAGVYAYGPFDCQGCHIEKIDSIALHVNARGSHAYFTGGYIESPNYQGDYTTISDTDTVAVRIENAFVFDFRRSSVRNNLSTLHTFELGRGVDLANFFYNRFLFVKPGPGGFVLDRGKSVAQVVGNTGDRYEK